MKRYMELALIGLAVYLPLMPGIAPDFVQVPSAFSTQTIATNTSRYFLQRMLLIIQEEVKICFFFAKYRNSCCKNICPRV